MSRIDAVISSQVGEITRPAQQKQDTSLQRQQADVAVAHAVASGAGPDIKAGDFHAVAAQLKKVIETASGNRLSLSVDDKTEEVFAVVHDAETGEVIYQIPSKEMLQLHAHLREAIGMILDHKG